MDKEIFEGIKQGMEEAIAYARGEEVPGVRVHHVQVPDAVDVKSIRAGLNMTQAAFAETFGFSLRTLKSWEAGTRKPEDAARVLLRTIAYRPQVVIEANQGPR